MNKLTSFPQVVEAIVQWQSLPSSTGRPFIWNNSNYLLKMWKDLDFLADIRKIVKMLNIRPSTIRSNPFMMPQNLRQRAQTMKEEGLTVGAQAGVSPAESHNDE